MTHRQALQDFRDTIQVSLHKNNKINLPIRCAKNAVPLQAHTLYRLNRLKLHHEEELRGLNSSTNYFGRKHVHVNETTLHQKKDK
jgi:hypothetical protein